MRGRIVVGLALGLSALVNGAARADECPSSMQVMSCHNLAPAAAIATEEDTAVVPLATYTPFVWRSAHRTVAPPSYTSSQVTNPGIDISLGAGGWGTGAKEPMALVRATQSYLVDEPDVMWFMTPTATGIPCQFPSSLCYEWGSSGEYHSIWTTASSAIFRRYRVTQVQPGTLPNDVSTMPIMVDYRMGIYVTGTTQDVSGTVEGLSGQTGVQFGYFYPNAGGTAYSYNTTQGRKCGSTINGLRCAAWSGAYALVGGREDEGTFVANIGLAALDRMALRVYAELRTVAMPMCSDQTVDGVTQCVVAPYLTNGHAVSDPYVYIDPSWPYASWFKLEVAADETDTTWEVPEHTLIDLETLVPIEEPDAGTSEPDAGDDSGVTPEDAAVGDGDGDGDGDTGDGDGDTGDGDGDTGDGDGDGDTGDGDGDTGDGDSDTGDGDGDSGDGDGDDAGSAADAGDAGSSGDGGCGCRTAGNTRAPSSLALISLFGLVAALRMRRRARD